MPTMDDRLRQLRDLKARGKITENEDRRLRALEEARARGEIGELQYRKRRKAIRGQFAARRARARWKSARGWLAIVAVGVLVLVIVAAVVGLGLQANHGKGDGSAAPAYEIAKREDISFGAVVRIVYRVRVDKPLTEAGLRAIAERIIDQETSRNKVNAIGFLFYLPGSDATGIYTAGKADWAPNGDWAKADSVRAGDYSKNRLGGIDLGGP